MFGNRLCWKRYPFRWITSFDRIAIKDRLKEILHILEKLAFLVLLLSKILKQKGKKIF